MAALLILYCIIFALVIVGTIGIFTIKNTILQKNSNIFNDYIINVYRIFSFYKFSR